jgi:hypothetical protein
MGVHKQANGIVEAARISLEHLLCQHCKQDQEDDGAGQPGDERGAQTRKHGWSIR